MKFLEYDDRIVESFGRPIKIFTMISLDGARFCIRGKAGLSEIGLMNMMPFVTSYELETYIKKIESFHKRQQGNPNIVWEEEHDGISIEKNKILYECYMDKLLKWPYNTRPGNATLLEKLSKKKEMFSSLDIKKQVTVLIQLQGVFGRIKQADLKALGESSSSGISKMSFKLSNWKKNYSDVRIIDQSASGLYEKISDNLLDLL